MVQFALGLCCAQVEALIDIAYNCRELGNKKGQNLLVSIDFLLQDLVSSVDGATGAIVLEADGEAVQWFAAEDGERLRLRGAYIALMLKASQTVTQREGLGNMSRVVLEYETSSFVVISIDGDCFLMVELERSANIGYALYRCQRTAELIREEITA